jgi:hypothetical protein
MLLVDLDEKRKIQIRESNEQEKLEILSYWVR